MAIDITKRNKYNYRWTKENCSKYGLKIRNDSGIPDCLSSIKESGASLNSYIIVAIREKLIRDGYLSAEPQTPEE